MRSQEILIKGLLLIGGLLFLVPLLRAAPPREQEVLDLMLRDFRKEIDVWLQLDTTRYQGLKKSSPRALIRWKGDMHRFPPLPDMEPSPEELGNTYPLAALPPEWVDRLNEIGEELFAKGLQDGQTGEIDPVWKGYQDELDRLDVPRVPIPSLSDLAPGFSPKSDYKKIVIPFEEVEDAQGLVESTMAEVPGASRLSILTIPDDNPLGGALVQSFLRYEDTARSAARALRSKIEGILKGRLLQLQRELYAELQLRLGREVKGKDVQRFGKLMSKQWRTLIRWNHARHYFSGYRATSGATGGGTGDGTSPIEYTGGGTGDGSGSSSFQGSGTGDGTSTTPIPGGGTGDGSTATPDPDAPGTGDGVDERGTFVSGGTGG